jgi:hypothetical protein
MSGRHRLTRGPPILPALDVPLLPGDDESLLPPPSATHHAAHPVSAGGMYGVCLRFPAMMTSIFDHPTSGERCSPAAEERDTNRQT